MILLRHLRHLMFVALAGGILAGCQSIGQNRVSLDDSVRLFNDLAFAVDVNRQANQPFIRRLPARFDVSVMETQDASQEAELRRNLDEYAQVTGVAVDWRPAGDKKAFMQVHFTKDRNFVINRNEPAECYTHADWRHPGPGAVEIYVGVDSDGKTQICLTHELMHAFGFPGHSFRKPNALNLALSNTSLTEWDKLLLRTLYDARLQFGMDRQTALPLARDILARLIEQGTGV